MESQPEVPQPQVEEYSSKGVRILGAVLLVLGVLLVAVGAIYFSVQAGKLPSFLGKLNGETIHRTKRGTAALVAGAACLIGSGFALTRKR